MIEVYNRNLERIAYLENARDIEEERQLNSLSYFSFSLPYDDHKNEHCQPFNFVKFNNDYYRIMPITDDFAETSYIDYQCESAIATLIDDVMIGWKQIGNIGTFTREVIDFVLGFQTVKYWKLGELDFNRQFEYGWQDENLYSALLSIPSPITTPYKFIYDFSTTPWTINLKAIDENANPSVYSYEGKDALKLTKKIDTQQIFTRIVPRGYGEGVNQLDIKAVNNGVEWLQSPQEYINKYGLKTLVWTDRRYESAETLKAMAENLLLQYQEPYIEYSVDVLYNESIETADKVRVKARNAFETFLVTGIKRKYNEVPTMQLTIANRPQDIASTIADLMDRQRIESTYSQGATQLYSHSTQANADSVEGAEVSFYVPTETRVLNMVSLKVKLSAFRAYSKSTNSGGDTDTKTSSISKTGVDGGSVKSSGSAGGTSVSGGDIKSSGASSITTTVSGGGGTTFNSTGSSGSALTRAADGSQGEHRHEYDYFLLQHTHDQRAHTHSMPHTHQINTEHSHKIDSHTHTVNTEHTHNISHTHTIDTEHTHEVEAGIYRFGATTGFTLQFNGDNIALYNTNDVEIDVTDLLVDPDTNEIPRGQWYTLKIIPTDLAYIQADVFIQSFIQSRGGEQY